MRGDPYDLNFYPEDHPEDIAAIPELVAGCDLGGIADFHQLVRSVHDGRLMLWRILWEDDDGEIRRRDHKWHSEH